MAPEQKTTESGDADIAKAFQELAKGERAASAMENQLTVLERKIDALLASADSSGDPNGNNNDDDGKQQRNGRKGTTENQ
ncbi:MAG: hypothetical protein Q9209_001814 [Squamulea sp. 1 TL-2023]